MTVSFAAVRAARNRAIQERVLGAILASGVSEVGGHGEFDTLQGRPLIAHVLTMVTSQTGEVTVFGGHYGGHGEAARSGLPVLKALSMAMDMAIEHGRDAVFTCPYRIPYLPKDLVSRERVDAPWVAAQCPLVGLWPIWLAEELAELLQSSPEASFADWIDRSEARRIDLPLAAF